MNSQILAQRRMTDAASERIPQDIDRFENEGGPGADDTRHSVRTPHWSSRWRLPGRLAAAHRGSEVRRRGDPDGRGHGGC